MALIKFGGGVVGMSGSIAGNTFARNRYGSYVRARTIPVNPATSRQQSIRNIASQMAAYWSQTLTAVQRTAWGLYAENVSVLNRLGESVNLSGFNMFCRSNAGRVYNGLAIVADGPTTFALPETDATFAIAASEATGLITFTFDDTMDWCDLDDAGMCIYESRPYGAGVSFYAGPWSLVKTIEGDSVAPPSTGETQASRWTLTEGEIIRCRARISLADGRLSTFFWAQATVGA